jgi:hypothetical protein
MHVLYTTGVCNKYWLYTFFRLDHNIPNGFLYILTLMLPFYNITTQSVTHITTTNFLYTTLPFTFFVYMMIVLIILQFCKQTSSTL